MKPFVRGPLARLLSRMHLRRNFLCALGSAVFLLTNAANAAPENGRQTTNAQNKQSLQSSITVVQSSTAPVDPQLRDAYLAYRNGKLDEAQPLYLAMYRKDARNPDVLLGLASIAQLQGENLKAAHYFTKVLSLYPRNAIANAAMSALNSGEGSSESRLETLLQEQRNSAALHFALGNIYAGQSRWSEAQQRYSTAFMLEPDNAGFAFNLAVSLDHLGQHKLAIQHYRRALELDEPRNAGFDHAQVSQHIEELARHENAG